MKKNLFLFLLLNIVVFSFASIEEDWDSLLKKYTSIGKKNNVELTLVDYAGIKTDPKWTALLRELSRTTSLDKVDAITTATPIPTKNKELSFWINAYNIGAVKIMIDNYPLKSIKDKSNWFSSVWDQEIVTVNGAVYSLGYIEHQILRKMHEPQIHVAIVCASVSCLDLRQEAFHSATLYKQFNSQWSNFLNNSNKGLRVDKQKKIIYLSAIFKWFENDFKEVRPFVAKYVPKYEKQIMSADYQIQYLNYEWASNEKMKEQ